MSKIIFLVVFVLSLVVGLGPSTAEADYTRSCSAKYRLTNAERNMVTAFTQGFSARASDRWYIPNTIRVRAYRRARACLQAGYNNMISDSPSSSVPECDESHGIVNYPRGDVRGQLGNACGGAWHTGFTSVKVYGSIEGDKGCGGDRRSKSDPWIYLGTIRLNCW
jgi:hypothetical protein